MNNIEMDNKANHVISPARILYAALVSFVLVVTPATLAKAVMEWGISDVVGTNFIAGATYFNLNQFTLRDAVLDNFPGFKGKNLADIAQCTLRYSADHLLKGEKQLEGVDLHIRSLTVSRNAKGEINTDRLNMPSFPDVGIRQLRLKVDELIFEDAYHRKNPVTHRIALNLNETRNRVENVEAVLKEVGKNMHALAREDLIRQMDRTGLIRLTSSVLEVPAPVIRFPIRTLREIFRLLHHSFDALPDTTRL